MSDSPEFESSTSAEIMTAAIREIEQLVLAVHPDASFETNQDDASGATWVTIRADFDPDYWDDVVDIYIERLLEMQEETGLWLHFLPISTRALTVRARAA